VGTVTEADVHQALKDRLGVDDQQAEALMAGMHALVFQDNAQVIREIEALLASG
jgi:hypothetical protein